MCRWCLFLFSFTQFVKFSFRGTSTSFFTRSTWWGRWKTVSSTSWMWAASRRFLLPYLNFYRFYSAVAMSRQQLPLGDSLIFRRLVFDCFSSECSIFLHKIFSFEVFLLPLLKIKFAFFLLSLFPLWPFREREWFKAKLPPNFYWKLSHVVQNFLCFTYYMTLDQLFKFFVLLLSYLQSGLDNI